MADAERIALLGSGVYFLIGLLTGVWKYRAIMSSPTGQAHPYVDILHRASLMYAFASLVVWKFAELSPLGDRIELAAVIALEGYFGIAIGTYFVHALLKDTDNQMRAPFRLGSATLPRSVVEALMWSLIAAELGGFVVLFYGAGIGLSFW
jgi:hypothetical protein